MAKRKSVSLPKAMCDVTGCNRVAAYGFRERVYVTNNDSLAKEFIMGDVPNWCQPHDIEQRPLYAAKVGDYVKHPS
jgi:hypothetical protein